MRENYNKRDYTRLYMFWKSKAAQGWQNADKLLGFNTGLSQRVCFIHKD
jgi:hypothetical protein